MSSDRPSEAELNAVPCLFKRVKRRVGVLRKKEDQSSSDEDVTEIVKAKRVRSGVLSAVVKGSWSTSSSKKEGAGANLISEFNLRSTRSTEPVLPKDMGAAAHVETETLFDHDGQAIIERSLKLNKQLKGKSDDKKYRGISGYQQFYEREDKVCGNAASGHARTKGPMRAPVNIRVTTRWDYQPDICKDYKETGFCGFGDNCKFLHDRTEYKFGWEMEREEQTAPEDEHKYEIHSSGSNSSAEDDDFPTKCPYCHKQFRDPVKTKCEHYFCEKCALAHFERTSRCMSCGEETEGKFQPAKNLKDAIERKNKCEESEKKRDDDFPDDMQ